MTGTNPGAWPDQGRENMPEINTPICTHCGHPFNAHRTRELSCPVYKRNGELSGWSFHSFTTDPPPAPKLYTAAEMKAARREIVERIKVIVPACCWSKEAIEAIEKLKEEIENEQV